MAIYTVIVKATNEQIRVQASSADEAQRIVVLRKGISVAKTNAFLEAFVGEVMTPNGAEAVYFRTAEAAKRNTETFYDCLVQEGVEFYEERL